MYKHNRYLILLLLSLLSASYAAANENDTLNTDPERKPIVELSANMKVFYPDRMGISPNQSLLALLQTIPGLMNTSDSELSENVSLSVDYEAHVFDVSAVLRRLRVMDVERIEIVNTPDANSGTVGLGTQVNVILKKAQGGSHGHFALDVNTNRTIDPTFSYTFKKGKWDLRSSASFYFDRSKTTTTINRTEFSATDTMRTFSEETEKEDTYGENAFLKVKYNFYKHDVLSLTLSQEHLKVKSEIDKTGAEPKKEEDKQNSNSVKLGYTHFFSKAAVFKLSTTAKYQNNPHLYGYQSYNVNTGTLENSNVSSNTKHLYVECTQTLPLWKGASMQVGQKFDFSVMNELAKIRIDSTNNYYDVSANNSQTMVQLMWNIGKWELQAGEVIDYFHYKIGFTSLDDKDNKTTTPQTYILVGYKINPKNMVHFSYRTALQRPNYKQIYPITTAMDVDNGYVFQDSLFRALNNTTAHIFNIGHVYNYKSISVSSGFRTIVVNDMLNNVDGVWMNSAYNNYFRLYSSLVWTPNNFSTALTASLNQLYSKKSSHEDYKTDTGFDLRWMGVYNFKHDWNVGATIEYNGPVWYPYGKMGDYVFANVHVTKTVGHWSFNVCMNDILDMQIKTYKQTDTFKEKTTEERDYRGLSLGVSYKF